VKQKHEHHTRVQNPGDCTTQKDKEAILEKLKPKEDGK
jgi:hypothetical protein